MKVYQKKRISYVQDVIASRICDLCGEKAVYFDEWKAETYRVNETEIEIKIHQKEGDQYPEGGAGTKYDVDICPKCFKEKFVPWLISQGANIQIEEWDW